MIYLFALFLLTLLVITAIAIVRSENLFVSVMLTSIFSLLMAANFFILDAADVALNFFTHEIADSVSVNEGQVSLFFFPPKYQALFGRHIMRSPRPRTRRIPAPAR